MPEMIARRPRRLDVAETAALVPADNGIEGRRFAGSCRQAYNRALALQKARYDRGEKRLGYAGLCQELTAWRKDEVWLRNSHSQVLQQALKDLDRAYRNFFEKRAAFPRFKKKGRRDSFRFPQGTKLDQPNDRIYLPKLGWMRYHNSRHVLGQVRGALRHPLGWQGVRTPEQLQGSSAAASVPPAPDGTSLHIRQKLAQGQKEGSETPARV